MREITFFTFYHILYSPKKISFTQIAGDCRITASLSFSLFKFLLTFDIWRSLERWFGQPNIVFALLFVAFFYLYDLFVYYVNWLTWRYLREQKEKMPLDIVAWTWIEWTDSDILSKIDTLSIITKQFIVNDNLLYFLNK